MDAPALPDLLAAAAEDPDDVALADRFAAALLAAPVTVLGTDTDDGGFRPLWVDGPTGSGVAFFSSAAAAQPLLARPDLPPLSAREVDGRTFLAMAVQQGTPAVLDVGNPYGKHVTLPEMADLLAGVRPGTTARAQEPGRLVEVGPAHDLPPALVADLARSAAALDVESATLAAVRYADGLRGLLLEVVTALPREQVVAGLAEAGQHRVGTLELVVLAPGAARSTAGVPPLHERPRGRRRDRRRRRS